MVLSFIRGESGPGDIEELVARSIGMLGDAHRSFELATQALLTDDAPDNIAQDVYDLERRINRTEQELRTELVTYIKRRGVGGIQTVLSFTLLLKKIERCGDHAKNILELTEGGISLAAVPETRSLLEDREILSTLFARAADLLTTIEPDLDTIDDFAGRANAIIADCQARIDGYLTSKRPGDEVVPLAIYYRFHRRIAANLLGVMWVWAEPEQLTDPGDDDL